MYSGDFILALVPFLIMLIIYLVIIGIGFIALYFVVRAAINNSKFNQTIEALRGEISYLNKQIQAMKDTSKTNADKGP